MRESGEAGCPSGQSSTAASCWGGREQRGGELFVEGEEEFNPFAVVGEGLGAVAAFDGAVEALVGFDEFGRHEKRVVELREGGVGVQGAGIEDRLSEFFDFGSLGG